MCIKYITLEYFISSHNPGWFSGVSSKKVWVSKIFALVMKKRSLVAPLCRDDNCAMTSRGNLFNRHR